MLGTDSAHTQCDSLRAEHLVVDQSMIINPSITCCLADEDKITSLSFLFQQLFVLSIE